MNFFINKKNARIYKVASIIDFPGEGKIYSLKNKKEDLLIREAELKKNYIPYINQKLIKAESQTVDYYKELINIKDKLIERINKINQAIKYTNARLSGLDKNSPEGAKLDQSLKKYEDDLKYYQDVLEDTKDKIVDFQALQSRVTLERQIDLTTLYNDLGIDPETLKEEQVELIEESPKQTKEVDVKKEIDEEV